MKWSVVSLVLLNSVATVAQAESITIGSSIVSFPAPAGYCRAEGNAAAVFQVLAAADTANVTHVDFVPCATKTTVGFDHVSVKTPKNVVDAKMERAALLEALKPEFDKPEFKANVDKGVDQMSNNLSESTGQKIAIRSNFSARGVDKDCAYIAGTLIATGGDGKAGEPQGAAACLSSVGGKFVSVNWYAKDPSPASVERLKVQARGMMLSMTARDAN